MSEPEKSPKPHSWRPWGDHPIVIFLLLITAIAGLYIAYKQYTAPDKTKEIAVVPTTTPTDVPTKPTATVINSTPTATPTPTSTPSPTPPPNIFYENGLKFSDISCRKSDGIICQFKIQNETDQTIKLKLQGSLYSRASDQAGNNLIINRVELGKISDSNQTQIQIPSRLDEPMTAIIELSSQAGATKVSELNLKFEIMDNNKEFRVIFRNIEIK